MSKLIVEMEMPKNCSECQLKMDEQTCFNGRGVFGTEVQRMPWCPICGVLPEEHGDLIDRDVLLETCIYYDINPNKSAVDADNIQDMPVIIAAERKDDEQIH